MKRLLSSVVLFSFFLIIFSSVTSGQTLGVVGKKFKKAEANILFGTNISTTIVVPKSDIMTAVEKAGNYVLFSIKNARVYVLDEKKISYYDKSVKIGKDKIAYIFSTSVVKEFLNSVKGTYLTFELRNPSAVTINKSGAFATAAGESGSEVFTITGDNEVLEMSIPCPPVCLEP
jgi:hypothetical protein